MEQMVVAAVLRTQAPWQCGMAMVHQQRCADLAGAKPPDAAWERAHVP